MNARIGTRSTHNPRNATVTASICWDHGLEPAARLRALNTWLGVGVCLAFVLGQAGAAAVVGGVGRHVEAAVIAARAIDVQFGGSCLASQRLRGFPCAIIALYLVVSTPVQGAV